MPKNNVVKGKMRIKEKSYFTDSFVLPNQGLKTYFGNVVKGQPKVFETPFAKGESTSTLMKRWMEVLVSISDTWPSLLEYEKDLANKVGPMSVMLPLKDRMQDIDSYYEGITLPQTHIDQSAVAAVVKEWDKARGLSLRSKSETLKLMKLSTNSGSPFFTRRRLVANKTRNSVVESCKPYIYQSIDKQWWCAAAVLGWRGQEGGLKSSDVKQRVVWMFPFAVNLHELRCYQPLIEAAQRFNIVPPWVGMDAVDDRITALFDTKGDSDLVVCTDFSKFDQHFNPVMQEAAKTILSKLLNGNGDSTLWLENIYPIKYSIPLAYDWNRVRFGLHGMGSGSGGTNADETLAHRALQYEAAQRAGAKLNPNSMCLGDDGILTYPGITIDDVVKAYVSHGQEMNKDKQYASTQDCIFLRRWHHKDYRVEGKCAGVYSTCRALGRLRYLERYQDPEFWGPEAVALRQLSIIENVKNHPLKEEFVQFCMKRDKYRLGIDIPNFLSDIRDVAEKYIENMPDFLGYTKSLQSGDDPVGGIESWWIVKYLLGLK